MDLTMTKYFHPENVWKIYFNKNYTFVIGYIQRVLPNSPLNVEFRLNHSLTTSRRWFKFASSIITFTINLILYFIENSGCIGVFLVLWTESDSRHIIVIEESRFNLGTYNYIIYLWWRPGERFNDYRLWLPCGHHT